LPATRPKRGQRVVQPHALACMKLVVYTSMLEGEVN